MQTSAAVGTAALERPSLPGAVARGRAVPPHRFPAHSCRRRAGIDELAAPRHLPTSAHRVAPRSHRRHIHPHRPSPRRRRAPHRPSARPARGAARRAARMLSAPGEPRRRSMPAAVARAGLGTARGRRYALEERSPALLAVLVAVFAVVIGLHGKTAAGAYPADDRDLAGRREAKRRRDRAVHGRRGDAVGAE